MAYRDDVAALNPSHIWRFDGDVNDSVGSANGTNTGMSLGAAAITEDATNSVESNGTSDRIETPNTATINAELSRKAVGGWIRIDRVQPPPKSIYREGSTASQFCFVCWAGNAFMLDVINNGDIQQLFGSRTLAPNRIFHLFATWSGTGFDSEVALYLDGVQVDSGVVSASSLTTRGTGTGALGTFSDPAGSTEVGNQTVLLNGLLNCRYGYWAAWGDTVLPTSTEIREELFEKGVLPSVTIASDTEVNMQAALDALADTTRGDEPLNIRVEGISGGGTLNLTADNIVHSPLASIHVQYTGTDTLNWTNINGSNASIGSSINGGVLNFINPAVLTLEPLIADSEVRIYEAGTTTEIAGIESSGTSFQTSIEVNSVDIVIHKEDYEYVRIAGVDTSGGDLTVPIDQVFDRNYANV